MTATPLLTGTLPGVPGDVDADVRLVFTDMAGQSRRFLELGIQQRFYQGLALQIDSASLTTSGFAGASTAGTGSYNTNVVRATLTTNEVTVCSTGSLGHVGVFRVWARVRASSTDVRVRLAWQDGSGPFRSNAYATPVAASAMVNLDLGTITVQQALAGTQQWVGRINALGDVGDTLDVDFVTLIPAGEGYCKALAPQTFETVTAFSARDEFNQTAGALAGKAAAVGGNWAGAGDTDDFQVEATGNTLQRTAVSDSSAELNGRFATVPVTMTDTVVSVDMKVNTIGGAGTLQQGVLARYTDTANWLRAELLMGSGFLEIVVEASLASSNIYMSRADSGNIGPTLPAGSYPANNWVTLRMAVIGSTFAVWLGPTGGRLTPYLQGQHSSLASGTLASGKPGIYDGYDNAAARTRSYDNFFAAVPTDTAVLFSGRQAQIRSDDAIRQDSTGTYNGPLPAGLRGSYPTIPPAGAEGRTTRIAARALRNNPDEMANPNVTDALSAQALITPRFLAPR